jgi:hypothetical protein
MSTLACHVGFLILATLLSQDTAQGNLLPPKDEAKPAARVSAIVEWQEGRVIPVRVPVTAPGRESMTTISFPEEAIEAAITGWGDADITAIQKRGLLFIRLAKKSEGQLNVIGGSGTHYLLYLTGSDGPDPDAYDTYVKIRKKEPTPPSDALPKHPNHRPSGALELIQAMRQGLHPENVKILRANHELAYESPTLEMRLAYVYDAQSYRGFIYEVKNRTDFGQSVDASRLRGKGTALILTALKENVLLPKATTRLYVVTWKD